MNNRVNLKSLDESLTAVYQAKPRQEFQSSLRAQIDEQIRQMMTAEQTKRSIFRRSGWAYAALVAVFVTVFIFAIGPRQVLAGVYQLLGYIPGVGFVGDSQTVQILAEPVSINHGNLTLTLEDAVTDEAYTRLFLRVDGLQMDNGLFQEQDQSLAGRKSLIQPDGSEIVLKSWSVEKEGDHFNLTYYFDPLPQRVASATLFLDQLPGQADGAAPEGWQLEFQLQSGVADERLIEAVPVNVTSQAEKGITMVLESRAQTPSGDVFSVKLVSDNPDLSIEENWAGFLSLESADGKKIPINGNYDQNGLGNFTFQTPPLASNEDYSLKLSGPISIFTRIPIEENGNRFEVDLGDNQKPWQNWELDQSFQSGGRSFHLIGAQMAAGNACEPTNGAGENATSLLFSFEPVNGVDQIMVTPLDGETMAERIYLQGSCILYPQQPSGRQAFAISGFSSQVEGNWMLTWRMQENK